MQGKVVMKDSADAMKIIESKEFGASFASMDRLLEWQEQIQQKLVDKHLSNDSLALYDITSSYFEGEYEKSEIDEMLKNR